ncbi:uncharacterized protein PAC_04823 [Phialocephala subalpina]|uniref:Uncharacterized protein n=1 Tax=Phialocephala subalpina TaxID=576137 RepID=A0A1L7WQA0_9HELO|nr:uncharacterized protein PAC_04823 [Phialocephala subalpina]
MRLLHTTTLKMEEFFASDAIPNFVTKQLGDSDDRKIPEYAILSHVWGPEEISFQDITGDRTLAKKREGFPKLRDSCKQARRDGYEYIWIDTCCIDKTSSTELSEAINSMFQWYKDSAICYVYLSDVEKIDDDEDRIFYAEDFTSHKDYRRQPSRWFSRGWTLQELLAPSRLRFFNTNWISMGMKEDHLEVISKMTHIDLFALKGGDLRRLSVARRMSWAANRQTTRAEDIAYCLLGIFNINMPLLYGEGANAYIRLQEEILKVSDDQSLFGWKDPLIPPYRDDYPEAFKPQGILAASPEVFNYSQDIAMFYAESPGRTVSMSTNKGLRVEFLMCQDKSYPSGSIFLAILTCHIGSFPGMLPAIRLRRLSPGGEQYARIDVSQLLTFGSVDSLGAFLYHGFDPTESQPELKETQSGAIFTDWTVRTVFIRQEPQVPLLPGFWLMPFDPFTDGKNRKIKIVEAYPPHLWDPGTGVMQPALDNRQGTRKLGAFAVEFRSLACVLMFGVTYWELTPWCEIMPNSRIRDHCEDHPGYCKKIRQKGDTSLKSLFDEFQVKDVKLPTDMETRRHECIRPDLGVMAVAQLRNVSGKDIYLLYLHYMSDDLSEKLKAFNCR